MKSVTALTWKCLPPSTPFPLDMQIIPKTQTWLLISCSYSLIMENLIDTRSSWNYANHWIMLPLIAINEEHIHMKKQTITKDRKNEKEFIKQLGEQISNINTSDKKPWKM